MSDQLKAAQAELAAAPKTNIKGKQYATVATRVDLFHRHFSDLAIVTEVLSADGDRVMVRATIQTGSGLIRATGHAEENRKGGGVNATSALENCETSAIGRALAIFGLAGGEIASADEVKGAIASEKNIGGGKPTETDKPGGTKNADWKGPLNKTELGKRTKGLIDELESLTDMDQFMAWQSSKDYRTIVEQMLADCPSWFEGQGDAKGFKAHVDERVKFIHDAEAVKSPAFHG